MNLAKNFFRYFTPALALGVVACVALPAASQPIYTQVSAGDGQSCAVTTNGAVHCWGANTVFGTLGNGGTAPSGVPVAVRGISTAAEVRASLFHTCARLTDGSVRCWGRGTGGALGQDSFTNSSLPVTLLGFGPAGPAIQLGLGAEHTCVLSQAKQVFCAGRNDYGQAGQPIIGSSSARASSVPILNVDEIAIGAYHSCARVGGTVSCWGANTDGQLGDGSLVNSRSSPAPVTGIGDAVAISAGRFHTCALIAPGNVLTNSSIVCWGSNLSGQLGDGSSGGISRTPVTVAALGAAGVKPQRVAAGAQHSCALLTNQTAQCWGANGYGAIGDGTFISSVSPKTVVGLPAAGNGINVATAIAAGNDATCVIMTDGGVRCWGMNETGQGGHGHGGVYQTTPQYVAAPGCALDLDGDGVAQLTTDAVLLARALRGLGGTAVNNGVTGPGTRTSWAAIRSHVEQRCGVPGLAP
jgi:alpha-tubulin suppressor-like RCC1 family protein